MKRKVFLTGGDGLGWAVDEDLRLTAQSMKPLVDFSDASDAEVIHALWWYELLELPTDEFVGKRIICHVTGEPFRYLALPEHRPAMEMVGRWITRTRAAADQLASVGVKNDTIPYLIDTTTFRPLPEDDPSLDEARKKWGIPKGPYLIGSFQRDTEGADLISPKLVKGPDVLLEILLILKSRGLDLCAVLAGPRRHWLMKRFDECGIPYVYTGIRAPGDDLVVNSRTREELNTLYNLLDTYVISSRSEGGPHAILEAASAKCKVVSTPVGTVPEIAAAKCIYRIPSEAADIIMKDAEGRFLADTIEPHHENVRLRHTPESATRLFAAIYEGIDDIPPYAGAAARSRIVTRDTSRPLKVGLWHSFYPPPYGGGNQFMIALRKAFQKRGVEVVENVLDESIDAYVLNSIHFDVDAFLEFGKRHRLNVVHRIDGPIQLIRGFDQEKDELCYELNARFASATVLQSTWVYTQIVKLGYQPVSPTIIQNAADSDIFHPHGRVPFARDRKIRLISTSWSNNPRKGGPIYKFIEEHLDWDRYEYTFTGNVSEDLGRIRRIAPVPSEELAGILREHDVYITASSNDPCSNALIEALSCGLPALYLNDGGHPELTGYGGLPFSGTEDVIQQLDKLTADYESIQRLITTPSMDQVAEKYLAIVRDIVR